MIAAGTRVGSRLVVAGSAITECPKLAGADFIKVHDPMQSPEVLLAPE